MTRQNPQEGNGKVRYVTHMLHNYDVRNGVGHCVKMRVILHQT